MIAVLESCTPHVVELQTEDGVLFATGAHPFWVPSEDGWRPADALRSGMTLQDVKGRRRRIEGVSILAASEDTWNLEVDSLHNFYVGAAGYLVHNQDRPSAFASTSTTPTEIYAIYEQVPVMDDNGNIVA